MDVSRRWGIWRIIILTGLGQHRVPELQQERGHRSSTIDAKGIAQNRQGGRPAQVLKNIPSECPKTPQKPQKSLSEHFVWSTFDSNNSRSRVQMVVGVRDMMMRGLEMGCLDWGTITRIMTALNLCIRRREISGRTGSGEKSISHRCLPAHNLSKSSSLHACSGKSSSCSQSKAIPSRFQLRLPKKQLLLQSNSTPTSNLATCTQFTKYQSIYL